MNQKTLEEFQDYLTSKSYSIGAIAGYIRTIEDLAEPPEKNDPVTMLDFVDKSLRIKKTKLNRPSFNTARASLNAFFLMKTGIRIKEFRRQCIPPDRYTSLMEQYSDYCTGFLQLTDAVARAAVRETKRFLASTSQDPERSDWTDVTADDVISYLAKERSDLSIGSLGVTVTAIRRFFRFLEQKECKIHTSILHLPLSIPNWSRNGNLPVLLTQEQLLKLTSTEFDSSLTGLRNRVILLCFTELGLRCSEVARLQFDDVKWHSGTVLIRRTKTHAQRELPLSEKLGEAMEEYVLSFKTLSQDTFLFFKSERHITEPASTENIRGVIRRLLKKCGITGWHMGTHALRRTAGSRFYQAGNGLKTVADILGHESITTTTAYVRVDVESLKTVASSWPRRDMV